MGDGEEWVEAAEGRKAVQMSCRIALSCAMRRSMSRGAWERAGTSCAEWEANRVDARKSVRALVMTTLCMR